MKKKPEEQSTQRDYFAELYLAGVFGDAGWAVYFPKRDVGFDFVISRPTESGALLRPVQVKGLYPTSNKTDKTVYGYRGRLSATHPEMVLAMPFFSANERGVAPEHIAYMPFCAIKTPSRGGYRCQPAKFKGGLPTPRPEYLKYFGEEGLLAVARHDWGAV